MPHNVAPINSAIYNKSKAAFRLPSVRRTLRERRAQRNGKVNKQKELNLAMQKRQVQKSRYLLITIYPLTINNINYMLEIAYG